MNYFKKFAVLIIVMLAFAMTAGSVSAATPIENTLDNEGNPYGSISSWVVKRGDFAEGNNFKAYGSTIDSELMSGILINGEEPVISGFGISMFSDGIPRVNTVIRNGSTLGELRITSNSGADDDESIIPTYVSDVYIVIDGGKTGVTDGYTIYTNDGGATVVFDEVNDLILHGPIHLSIYNDAFNDMSSLIDEADGFLPVDISPVKIVTEPVVITSPTDGADDVDPDSAMITVVNNVEVGTVSVVVMDALGENELLVVTESISDDFDISPAMKYGEGRIIYASLKVDNAEVAIAGPISIMSAGCTSDSQCADDVFCNGEEVCGVSGQCEAGVEPCNSDQICDNDTLQCLAQMCFDGSDCAFGSVCQAPEGETEEVCTSDDPVSPWESLFIGEGGWWAFPKYSSHADRFVFGKQWLIAAAFNEDYTTCQGIPEAILKYRPIGSQAWKSVVATESYPGAEEFLVGFYLPVEDMPDSAYELQVGYTDCARNMSESRSFYFTLDLQ